MYRKEVKPNMKKLLVLFVAFVMTVAFASMSFAFKKDVTFAAKKDEGKVVFSHEIHTEKNKLKCTDCHEAIFKKKAGADDITMAAINDGKFCGTCHNGDKAFSAKDDKNCSKCHTK